MHFWFRKLLKLSLLHSQHNFSIVVKSREREIASLRARNAKCFQLSRGKNELPPNAIPVGRAFAHSLVGPKPRERQKETLTPANTLRNGKIDHLFATGGLGLIKILRKHVEQLKCYSVLCF